MGARIPRSCLALLLGSVLLWAGCSGGDRATSSAPGDAFVRDVTPFPVADSTGAAIAHPFLGGLNTPRPQLVDIDGDGDDDLFIQEVTDRIQFYERVRPDERIRPTELGAVVDSAQYVWRTDRYRDLSVGEWFRFADLDGDGDADLLAEQPYSYIRLYENTGTGGVPEFTLSTDTLRAPDGSAIFSDRQNIPTVADVDCDDRLDLFLGRLDGTVDRYEATSTSEPGTMPTFELVEERFEDIEIVNQIGTLHGANTLAFADPDQDGDLDLFWGDYFEPGLLLIENRGDRCSTPDLRTTPRVFPPSNPLSTSGYNAPALGDPGMDGDLDVLVGVLGGAYDATTTLVNNLYFYENEGESYRLTSRQYVGGIDVGNESTLAVGDVDGDGDLDVLLANKIEPSTGRSSRVRLLENVGSRDAPRFRLRPSFAFPEAYRYAPALGDLTGDGRPDLLLGTWQGGLLYAQNDNGAFAPDSAPMVEIPRGNNAVPTLGDLDGDGDLDLLVGEGAGTVNWFENVGTPSQPRFSLVTEELEGVRVPARSAPHLADLDDDGRLDLLVGSERHGIHVFRNVGTSADPAFAADSALAPEERLTPSGRLAVDAPRLAVPVLVDLDGNGARDLLSGGGGGGLLFWRGR